MRACTQATAAELRSAFEQFREMYPSRDVRSPETGLVMLRGRIGGDGAAFNVGEATVTRAVVQLQTGELGYSYMLGRSPERARMAAMLDAVSQTSEAAHDQIVRALLNPVAERVAAEARAQDEKTAATRVDFFTLARGED